MASYSFTTDTVQELALTALREQENAEAVVDPLAPPAPPRYADNQAYVTARVTALLAPAITKYIEQRLHVVADAYRSPTTTLAQRKAVEKALGIG